MPNQPNRSAENYELILEEMAKCSTADQLRARGESIIAALVKGMDEESKGNIRAMYLFHIKRLEEEAKPRESMLKEKYQNREGK